MSAMASLADVAERRILVPHARHDTRFAAMVVLASPFVRESLVRSLHALGAGHVIEAGSLAEARVRARGNPARELCVIDLHLPDGSGLALLRELRSLGWAHGLILTSGQDPYVVRAALAATARAFLISPAASVPVGAQPARPARPFPGPGPRAGRASGPEGMSGREIEVMQLVAGGRSNKEIGTALGLSALTVKSHLARMSRKLGTGDRAEMVIVSMRAGVVA